MGSPFKKVRKAIKKVVDTVTPKPLRRVVYQGIETFIDPKAAIKKAKKQTKSIVKAPGKWLKPKMPTQTVAEQPDTEEIRKVNARRLAGRRGSRSSSALSNTLG